MCAPQLSAHSFVYGGNSFILFSLDCAGVHIGAGKKTLPLPGEGPCVGGLVWTDQREMETESGESMPGIVGENPVIICA